MPASTTSAVAVGLQNLPVPTTVIKEQKTQVYLRREEHEALRKAAAEDRHRS